MQKDSILKFIYRFFDLIVLTYLVFDFGYSVHDVYKTPKFVGLVSISVALLVFNIYKFYYYTTSGRKKIALFNTAIIGLLLFISLITSIVNIDLHYLEVFQKIRTILEVGLIIYFIIRLMIFVRYIYEIYYNPAIVFVGSFFVIILIGAFLLMLPKATNGTITFTDALFTSTSAVCVTGLSVLNVSSTFTLLGQTILLCLIQIGGLGILTFTSFFSFFFRGSSSFREGLNVKDFTSHDNLKDVLKVALNIVIFTLSVEIIGAIFIYSSISDKAEITNKLFFSIFHSISAFCNAGFSTLNNGMSESYLSLDYYFQWVLMGLIVFGGLGYSIIFNFYSYLKNYILELFQKKIIHKKNRIVTLNTKIVLYTTTILLIGGFVFLYLLEQNNILLEHDTVFGKITSTAFHAVTPRTAGFNTIDYTDMRVPSLLFIIFLMWVGASPASTGGGIKTSTFALATLNIFAIATGKSRIQLFGRRISSESTSRAFAILCISLIVIGFAILGLLIFEPEGTDLLTVVFECFSAYSTVGLSLNFTPTLTEPSKYILIATMFIGRIGMLNLMIGMLRQINHQFYEYPKENILIN
ncbi:potassium uptake TrkH family protein [Flavobacterium arsenatis]|uniref:Potassium uptake TrkH family protein n=1 Tax=Flavobacterium arsenatis TaxID=1484332 RepID=A0ABU1TT41_9FLAO|nr:potassium transporter TrkG [Flavobacterium arsenatis]MDR6969038.1 potassium uptake TrkH family protein [Flavobacterium arsenatis]